MARSAQARLLAANVMVLMGKPDLSKLRAITVTHARWCLLALGARNHATGGSIPITFDYAKTSFTLSANRQQKTVTALKNSIRIASSWWAIRMCVVPPETN